MKNYDSLRNDLYLCAIKEKDPMKKETLFLSLEAFDELTSKVESLSSEVSDLRAGGHKTNYEQQRDIEDEIYFRKHGDLGMK